MIKINNYIVFYFILLVCSVLCQRDQQNNKAFTIPVRVNSNEPCPVVKPLHLTFSPPRLVKTQKEIVNWHWNDRYTPHDSEGFLNPNEKIRVQPLFNEEAGRNIITGVASDENGWNLAYNVIYSVKDGNDFVDCQTVVYRPVVVTEVNPCEEENACAKNGLPDSAVCVYIKNKPYRQSKQCYCKEGCRPGRGGAEERCEDVDMCAKEPCATNMTCTDLICPETRRCDCALGFTDKNVPKGFNCTNVNECETLVKMGIVKVPHGAECIDEWPPVGGCTENNYPIPPKNQKPCGYKFRCKEGYTTIREMPLTCVKPCSKSCPNGYCHVTDDHREICICNSGYEMQNGNCVLIKMCDRGQHTCAQPKNWAPGYNPKKEHSVCVNSPLGSYTCVCQQGFEEVHDKCIPINPCNTGEHNCMRSYAGGPERIDKDPKDVIANSYCEFVPNAPGRHICKCDNNAFRYNKGNSFVCIVTPDFNLRGSNPMYTYQFAKEWSDPSYEWRGEREGRPVTRVPRELWFQPLKYCGNFSVEYELEVNAQTRAQMDLEQKTLTKVRNVIVLPINRCSSNIPRYMEVSNPTNSEKPAETIEIDVEQAKHRCSPFAHCYNQKETCDYRCECIDAPDYKFEGDGFTCAPVPNPKLDLKKGFWMNEPYRSADSPYYGPDVPREANRPVLVNIVDGPEKCIVCGNKVKDVKVDINNYKDYEAYILEPNVVRNEDGTVQIIGNKKVSLTKKVEMTGMPINETAHNILYTVQYRGVTISKRRVVRIHVKDLSADIARLQTILSYLTITYYLVLFFLFLLAIYLAILILPRLYACFLYFGVGYKDRATATKALDSLYFFVHPFNKRARDQLIYEKLYIDKDD